MAGNGGPLDDGPPLGAHSAVLMYPFRHAVVGPPARRARRLDALGPRWRPWWHRCQGDGELEVALDDSYFLLPYLRSLLDPETSLLPRGEPGRQLAEAVEVAHLPAGELARRVPACSALRLTHPLGDDPSWARPAVLEFGHGDRPRTRVPFRVAWADVSLFPQGLGFLLLKVVLDGPPPTFAAFRTFLTHARQVQPPAVTWRLPVWEFETPDGLARLDPRDVVDSFLQGLTPLEDPTDPSETPTLAAFAARVAAATLPPTARFTATPEGATYGDAFRLHVFAALGAPADAHATPGAPPGPFASQADRLVYELATCTDTARPEYVPDAGYYAALLDRGRLAVWDNWRGLALDDNVAFVGLDPGSPFLAGPFAHNVESAYLKLHLLARYQKGRVLMMFGDLIRRDRDDLLDSADARRLWDEFHEFQNGYWFLEVTRKPIPTEIYRRFQSGMGTLPLYEEMAEQVSLMRDHSHRVTDERLDALMNVFAVLGVPVGIVVGLFGNLVIEKPGEYLPAFVALLAALTLASLLVCLLWRFDLLRVWRWGPRARRWLRRLVRGDG